MCAVCRDACKQTVYMFVKYLKKVNAGVRMFMQVSIFVLVVVPVYLASTSVQCSFSVYIFPAALIF